MRVAFDEFVVDFDERRLFAADREIRLTSRGFELLRMLIENRPKALKKDELVARLWPGTFVADSNLATVVADLRGALGGHASGSRFIRTVYGYGYSFAAAACLSPSAVAPAIGRSEWKLLYDDREIALHVGENVLGRSGPGVIVLDAPTVSRRHARLSICGDGTTVEDLGSKNGTWLGTTPISSAVRVQDGDRLRLGSLVVTVRFLPTVPSTETASHPRQSHDFARSPSRSLELTRAHS